MNISPKELFGKTDNEHSKKVEDKQQGKVEPKPAEKPKKPRCFIATKDFSTTINGVSRRFKRNELIEDRFTFKVLLEQKCPIEPFDKESLEQCPNCKCSFPSTKLNAKRS